MAPAQEILLHRPGPRSLVLVMALSLVSARAVLHQALATRPPEAAAAAQQKSEENGPGRTDRFGDPLPAGALARLGTVRFRIGWHGAQLALAADGKTLITGGWGTKVRLWDLTTGKERRRIGPFPYAPLAVALSPDSRTLVVAGLGKTLHFRDTVTGQELRQLESNHIRVSSVAFSPNGRTLASAGFDDKFIQLWDPDTGKEKCRCVGHEDGVQQLTFAPDSKTLASGSRDGTVRLWDVGTGRELRKLVGTRNWGCQLAFSPDGKTLAVSGNNDRKIHRWDVATGKELPPLIGDRDIVSCVAFSPDGKLLASGDGATKVSTIRLWDAATGKPLREIRGHYFRVEALVFTPDSRTLISAGYDGVIRLWDPATGKELRPLEAHRAGILSVTFSADGRAVATTSNDRTLRVWESATGRSLRHLDPQDGYAGSVLFTPAGQGLALAGKDQAFRVWDTGKVIRRFKGNVGQNEVIALSPDGKRLAAGGNDQAIHLWDVTTGKEVGRLAAPDWVVEVNPYLRHLEQIHTVAFAPDSRTLASLSNKPRFPYTVRLWDTVTGKEVRRYPWPGAYEACLAFSPDGRSVAAGGAQTLTHSIEGIIHIWDVVSGKVRHKIVLSDSRSWVCALTFTADGRSLASGHADGRVRLWEVSTGKERHCFEGHQGGVKVLTIAPDGKTLASGSDDTTVLLWDLLGRVRARQSRKLSPREGDDLWTDLKGDAPRAYTALGASTAAPAEAVSFLKARLRPAPARDRKSLDRLIADLDSGHYTIRERASQELEDQGTRAGAALRQVLTSRPSLEVRRRIEELLARLEGAAPSAESVRTLRAVEALESIGTREARQVLESLAKGAPEARLTREGKAALERLAGTPSSTP